MSYLKYLFFLLTLVASTGPLSSQSAQPENSPRILTNLSGPDWQFTGYPDGGNMPVVDSSDFKQAPWSNIIVPHDFQTRAQYKTIAKGWYRRKLEIDPSLAGKEIYLVFEGAATVSDVYVNGQHLGQHRGGYTRFVYDATQALHPGSDNELAVAVDDSDASMEDCLPSGDRLYKVWGGLYRKVWLLALSPVHVDPTDFGAPGVYLTPKNVSENSADLGIRVLLQNSSKASAQVEVRAHIIDPQGHETVLSLPSVTLPPGLQGSTERYLKINQPVLWGPHQGNLYRVRAEVLSQGGVVDSVTETTGFRFINWDFTGGHVTVNGKPTVLIGSNLHQEIEGKGSALSDGDLRHNFDLIQDLGLNFMRLPHYPHARLEYDLCDQDGILCWAENGNSNGTSRTGKGGDKVGPIPAQITTEMVKQNYNHPSIVLWSVGNEASGEVADFCYPIVKALDTSRPVVVANMPSKLVDHHAQNTYPGWYGGGMGTFRAKGFISETGAGGVTTTHCDYNMCDWKVDSYEPEEYQQLVAENDLERVFHQGDQLGLFCWWTMRDFNDGKYKKPIGWNTKGLLTYAGDKKDVYYLFRSFMRPEQPLVWITSKRYFLRTGAVDNGIKVYSNAAHLSLTLNGQIVSTLDNGNYKIPGGPWQLHKQKPKKEKDAAQPLLEQLKARSFENPTVSNVFYWPVPLQVGKNVVVASDDQGHSDSAVIYYYGAGSSAAAAPGNAPIQNLTSSNAANPAYYMDEPVHDQWPIYYDLDSTADNSWNTLPDEIKGATWLTTRSMTKANGATDLSFSITRPVKVYVVETCNDSANAALAGSGFKPAEAASFLWRDNALQLVPAKLFVKACSPGETVHLSLGQADAVVLFK